MGFEALLGNPQLKARLHAALRGGRLSHCYLISGPAGSGKRTLARLLAAAMECTGDEKPCLRCGPCRKVLGGSHPDVVTVDDPEKKQIPVELVRRARTDAFIRPNEGQRKIFLFPRAHDLNEAGQNALLKLLEEPPAYGAFLLLADAPESLLPTIRSRCALLRLAPLPRALLAEELRRRFPDRESATLEAAAQQSGGFLGQAMALLEAAASPHAAAFAQSYARRDTLALLEQFTAMEKWKRAQLTPVLEELQRLLADALMARRGRPAVRAEARAIAGARGAAELLSACGALRAALDDCRANVGVANICAGLFVLLR